MLILAMVPFGARYNVPFGSSVPEVLIVTPLLFFITNYAGIELEPK
jgi:hypothetical protein